MSFRSALGPILAIILFVVASSLAVLSVWPFGLEAAEPATNPAFPPPGDDPRVAALAAFGYEVTGGAAPGYVEDRACGVCHQDIARSYQEVGMARSFATARETERIENFDAEPYFHELSGRYYRITEADDGGLHFRRWQVDPSGAETNVFEQDVDWVMGSGHTSRVYLYRTPSGEMFQLPLAWYSQEGGHWAMAPGLDRPLHDGVARQIQRECMFCHNAYPNVPENSDAEWAAHTFPEELPQGTGCQRCHGPGAGHVALAFGGGKRQEVIDAIVSPRNLEPALRRDICYGCHMQPVVAMMSVRQFGRDTYSYRPGESLSDYLVQMDAEVEGMPKEDRFEINHHPYRMEQSACFTGSLREDGTSALSCLTCHDPHRKVPAAEQAAHYRQACLGCHQVEQCDLEAMAGGSPDAVAALSEEQRVHFEAMDCAGCHMPRRRTQDVVHVAMTDHKITREAKPEAERLAPLEERDPGLIVAEFLRPDEAPPGDLGEIHKTLAVLQAGGGDDILDRYVDLLERHPVDSPEAWLAKAKYELQQSRFGTAESTVSRLLGPLGDEPLVLRFWGIARAGRGQFDTAAKLLARAVELEPTSHENAFNLGLVLSQLDRLEEAEAQLRRAIDLRSNAAPAHRHLGRVLEELERPVEAEASYRAALAAEPGDGAATLALGRLLVERGEKDEALRVLRHGARWARDPAPVLAYLDELDTAAAGP